MTEDRASHADSMRLGRPADTDGPTSRLAVWVGQHAELLRAWQDRCATTGHAALIVRASASLADELAASDIVCGRLVSAASSAVARASSRSQRTPRSVRAVDLSRTDPLGSEALVDACAEHLGWTAAEIACARWALLSSHTGRVEPAEVARYVRQSASDRGCALVGAAATVLRVLGPSGVLWCAEHEDEIASACSRALEMSAWPGIVVGIAVSDAAWRDYLASAPPSRIRDLLVSRAARGSDAAPEATSTGVGSGAPAAPESTKAATEAARAVDVARRLLAAGPVLDPEALAADDRARSLAERRLLELLERDPRTRGLFECSAPGGFRFGPREAEIDLLARSARVAVEVDGYYHFRDLDAWRRDRRKDIAMQDVGLLVVRCLAEDVVSRPAEVVDQIAEAVTRRVRDLTQERRTSR